MTSFQPLHHGTAAGVPYLAAPPPSGADADAPAVIVWHLMDAPRSPVAMRAALPLDGLAAWRVYLGLPMFASRAPQGGLEAIMQLAAEDAVAKLQGPVVTGAAAELPAALAALRAELGFGTAPIGLVGGSAGSAAAALVLAEGDVEVGAAVLVSPMMRLRPAVDALARAYGTTYTWHPEADRIAARLDFVARAGEIAARAKVPVRIVVGADDLADGFVTPARAFHGALRAAYRAAPPVDLVELPGVGHALADEPGVEAAPQTPAAARVDALATGWLRDHLVRP